MQLKKNDFKEFIKCIKSNENLGYLYTEKEIYNAYMLSITELKDKSINYFNCKSKSGFEIVVLTFDFGDKEIVTVHIILDFIASFIKENIRKSVKESELISYNIKLEQLIKECIHYEIVEVGDNRVMFLTFKGFGLLGIILEKE